MFSNSRRGGYGASSRGGYSGAVNIAPRFQTKRQIEAVDNARDQLVVNIKDNERQVCCLIRLLLTRNTLCRRPTGSVSANISLTIFKS